ncbi:MAG: hypothetical protein ACK5WD_11665 [bacterium]|jgi:hypothetical protein
MNLPTHEMSPDERLARTRGAINEFFATLVVCWLVGLGLVPVTVYILIQFDTPERGSLITVLGWIVVPSLHFLLPSAVAWRIGWARMEKRLRDEGVWPEVRPSDNRPPE